jgi:Cu+-exporting ATPase
MTQATADRKKEPAVPGHDHTTTTLATPGAVTDPVCGMTVDPATSRHRHEHDGATFHFCCAGCHDKFSADPARYLTPRQQDTAPPPSGAVYTCPMHPEIRQIGPGSCPICGMALEPLAISAEPEANPELADMKRRFWIGLVLAAPIFVLEMSGHIPGLDLHHLLASGVLNWIEFILATPVVLWAGWPFFQRGWDSLVRRSLNMFTLIAPRGSTA